MHVISVDFDAEFHNHWGIRYLKIEDIAIKLTFKKDQKFLSFWPHLIHVIYSRGERDRLYHAPQHYIIN